MIVIAAMMVQLKRKRSAASAASSQIAHGTTPLLTYPPRSPRIRRPDDDLNNMTSGSHRAMDHQVKYLKCHWQRDDVSRIFSFVSPYLPHKIVGVCRKLCA